MSEFNIHAAYYEYCLKKGIRYQSGNSVLSYDDTTLFCPAGMQQFKSQFKDRYHKGTVANIQPCLRMKDIDEIGDGTHLLNFQMMGLFSFREMSVKEAIDFWVEFIRDEVQLPITAVTIHPDKIGEWSKFYDGYTFPILPDKECIWSDGDLEGYCTEFYNEGVEIGNIVNIGGDCIDVGFGLERILQQRSPYSYSPASEIDVLKRAIKSIVYAGVRVGHNKHGYVLKKLIRRLIRKHGRFDENESVANSVKEEYGKEFSKFNDLRFKYAKLIKKEENKMKTPEWWWDTHGIDLKDMV